MRVNTKIFRSANLIRLFVFALLFLAPSLSLNAGESQALAQNKVYVVMSNTAHVYHSNRDCKGLQNATHKIKQVTVEEAKKMGRRPCKICYGH